MIVPTQFKHITLMFKSFTSIFDGIHCKVRSMNLHMLHKVRLFTSFSVLGKKRSLLEFERSIFTKNTKFLSSSKS